jgi:hypothetical protein
MNLQSTIAECIQYAPPEHLELALTAIIEARFLVSRAICFQGNPVVLQRAM